MIVRELRAALDDHASDGRGDDEPVLIQAYGNLRSIESVESHLMPDGHRRPMPAFVLIIADGPVVLTELSNSR